MSALVSLFCWMEAAQAAERPVEVERLALRREDGDRGPAAVRLRQLAALEERAGNHDLAVQAATDHLDAVGAGALVEALLAGSPGPQDRPADRLREAVAFAVAMGDRLRAPALVWHALSWSPDPLAGHRQPLVTALLRSPYLGDSSGHQELATLLGADPAWQAYLAQRQDQESTLSDDALAGLGDLGEEALGQRLTRTLEEGNLARARQVARRLMAADAWHVRARVAAHLLEDLDRHRLALTAADVAAASSVGMWRRSPIVVRLQRMQAARPAARGVTLALAYRLLEAHLFADVRRLVEPIGRAGAASAEERQTAMVLVALSEVLAGRPEEYRRWSASAGGAVDRSWYAIRSLLGSEYRGEAAPPSLRPLQRAALRQVFAGGYTPITSDLQRTWAREAALAFDEPTLQARAQAVLAETSPPVAADIARCLREKKDAKQCREDLASPGASGDGEDEEEDEEDGEVFSEDAVARIEKRQEVPASWLVNLVGMESASLAKLGPWLDRLPAARYAGTPGFVKARIAAHLAAGKAGPARAFFTRWGAVLPRGDRLLLRLLFPRIGRKLTPAAAARGLWGLPSVLDMPPERWDDGAPAAGDTDADAEEAEEPADDEDDESEAGEPAIIRQLRRAMYLRSRPAELLRRLRPLWKTVDGLEGAELAGHVFVAATAAREGRLAAEAMARVRRLAPGSALADHLSGGGDAAAAAARAGHAFAAVPRSRLVGATFVRAWLATARAPSLSPEASRWVGRAARGLPMSSFTSLDRAIERKLVRSTEDLRRLERSFHDRDLQLEWSPDVEPYQNIDWWVRERLTSIGPDQVVGLARRVLAYLDRGSKPGDVRELRAWTHFAAGDGAAALRAADAPAPRGKGVSFDGFLVSRIEAGAPVRLLGALRQPLEVPFRQKMLALFGRPHFDEKQDVPRQLWGRAEAARDAGDRSRLRQLACQAAGKLNRTRQAIELCGRAWASGEQTAGVAETLAQFVATDPDAARLESFDGEAFFRLARGKLRPEPPASLLHHHSLWLSKLQRHAEAAATEADAWAAGHTAQGFGLDVDAYGWVRYQPLLARYHVASGIFAPAQRNLMVATAALVGADVAVAAAHVRALEGADLSGLATELHAWAEILGDVVALAEADIQERRLDAPGLADAAYALVRGTLGAELPPLLTRFGRSHLLRTLGAEIELATGRAGPSATATIELHRRFPRNLAVGRMAFMALVVGRRLEEARAVLARLRAAHPGNPLADLVVPADAGRTPASKLPWAATAQGWAAALERASAEAVVANRADPVKRQEDDDVAAEVFLPASFDGDAGDGFRFDHDGVSLVVARAPRVTHCEGAACLEEMATALGALQVKPIWSRPVRLPAGDGQEGLFEGPDGLVVIVALPLGPNTYFITTGGAAEKLHARLPVVRLFRDTFRPLGALHGEARTTFLAKQTYQYPDGPVRARGRLAMVGSGTGCPVGALLSPLRGPETRGALLLDLLLVSARAEDRRRLLLCTSPERPEARALALPALWDTDQTIAAFGRAAVARHARRIREALQEGADEEPFVAREERDQAIPAGLLQALLALPGKERGALAARWFDSGDPRLRAVTLTGVSWMPELLGRAAQAEIVRAGTPAEVRLLMEMVPALDAPMVEATRARLDGLPERLDAAGAEMAVGLVFALAERLEPQDLARLEATARRLRKVTGPSESWIAFALQDIDAHLLGCQGKPARTLDPGAAGRLERWKLGGTPVRADTFGERPLETRGLPAGWSYFRIGQPGAFVAGMADLGRRLIKKGDPRLTTGQAILMQAAAAAGVDHLAESGLDLDSPFECVFLRGASGDSVCTGLVKDAAAVRRRLDQAAPGRQVPVTLPGSIGEMAASLPELAVYLPFALERWLDNHRPSGGAAAPAAPSERLLWERVDDTLPSGLRRRMHVSVDRNGEVDSQSVLVTLSGRRLWLVSDERAAGVFASRMAIKGRPTPQQLLGSAAGLDGAALRGIVSVEQDGTARTHLVDLAPTSDGLRVRASSPSGGTGIAAATAAELGALAAALPGSPTVRFAIPRLDGPPLWGSRPTLDGESLAPPAGPGPPGWFLQAADAVAFGWYPRTGEAVWSGWLTVAPWGPALDSAFRAHVLPAPGDALAFSSGLVYVRRGPWLFLGNSMPLVLGAAAAPPLKTPPAPVPLASASIEGKQLRQVLEGLAGRTPARDAAESLAIWTALAAMVDRGTLAGARAGDVNRFELQLRTATQDTAAAPALVDEWLRSTRLRNSLQLPRAIAPGETERPLVFGVRSARPDDLRRAFPSTGRVSLSQAGPQQFRLRVLPGKARVSLTGSPGSPAAPAPRTPLPGVSPVLQTVAREIVGALATPQEQAAAIITWVNREMTYEVTPAHLDDLTLLARKRGDCTEYSQLSISLLRALGIPARMRSGFMLDGQSLIAHAWLDFHDGQGWQEADPTAGRTTVDAAYLDASVIDVLSLMSVGQIEITSVQ